MAQRYTLHFYVTCFIPRSKGFTATYFVTWGASIRAKANPLNHDSITSWTLTLLCSLAVSIFEEGKINKNWHKCEAVGHDPLKTWWSGVIFRCNRSRVMAESLWRQWSLFVRETFYSWLLRKKVNVSVDSNTWKSVAGLKRPHCCRSLSEVLALILGEK